MGWSRLHLRPWTVAAFALILAATLITSSTIARIADDQDERLIDERASEAALFVESSLREVGSSFQLLGFVLQLASDPAQAFDLTAERFVSSAIRGVGLAEPADGSFETTALAGDGPAVGEPVSSEWRDVLARATTADGYVTGLVESDEEGRVVGLASQPEGLPIIFLELHLDANSTGAREEGSPFSDIEGALFVGPEDDPSQLLLSTDDLPLEGHVARELVTVGADEWLLLATSDGSLMGPLAERTRWGVLGGGLVLALLTATLIEMLSRRRAYALRLVDERTAELREARKVAEDANQSKSQFLSRMSHELRTPLNAVIGFGQLLELEPLDEPQRDSVAQILKGGRHLLDLINEVLDISRIEAGELALSPEAVHVPELVQEAVALVQPLANQRGIQLVADRSEAADCYVFTDRQRAKQILLNLLSNAVKYNRTRGAVAVSCELSADDRVRISVTDTGPGIPAELMGHLFTAFERLGAEHTGVEGTGIGLALSKRLAEAMGGDITVESTLGKGSTFSVDLPRVEDPLQRYDRLNGAGAHQPAAPEPHQPDVEHAVVLHIEDNLSNLKLIERIVAQRPGVEVVAAMHGRLGLELARERRPALVLLDLHLPDMGGEVVLDELRRDPTTASIPVVIVSADATSGQIHRLIDAGATAYLTKPIDVRELLTVLDEALGNPPNGG